MIARAFQGKALALVLFCLGIATGSVGNYVYKTRPRQTNPATTNRQADAAKEKAGFYDHLALSPQQRAEVDRVLDETRSEYQKLAAQTRPEATAIRQQNRERIRAVLTDRQRHKYDAWRNRHQKP